MSISNTSSDAAHGDLESLLLPRVARALLDASVAAVEPAPLAVVGTAGSGKSRVLRHLFTALRTAGVSPVALTHLSDLPAAGDAVVIVDDAHLLDDETLSTLADRLRTGSATVLLATRPDPDSPVLRALIDDIERHQPPMLLGHVTMSDVTAHLGTAATDVSRGCLTRLLEATGGLAWLTAEALMLHGDAICDGRCDHDEIARSLDDLVSHRIDSLDPSLRLAVEALCLDDLSRRCKQQAHRHVGDVVGQYARCIGDGDATRLRRCDVDAVVTDAKIGDQFQFRKSGDEVGRDH